MAQSIRRFKLPELKGGLNLRDLENKINDNQSPDMMNVWYRNRVLSKRWGLEAVGLKDGEGLPVTLEGTIHAISPEFEGYKFIHAGTKLYQWDEPADTVTGLNITAADQKGFFLEFDRSLCFCDGSELYQISKTGTSFLCAPVSPYVPAAYINCMPDLQHSDYNEAFNLIGSGFAMWYNGDAASTQYRLCAQTMLPLDNTGISVEINGVPVTAGFTFNHETGVAAFNIAPGAGQNNVCITAHKTFEGAKQKIAGCKTAIAFGGESTDIEGGTRAFLMRNAEYPQTYWYSDLGSAQGNGFAYFPENQAEDLIQNNEAITAAAKQGGELIIFKERSLFAVSYLFDGQEVFYPVREFNSAIGCDVPGSVQLIDNCLAFCSTRGGVFLIASTAGKAEDLIKPISANINGAKDRPGLLDEAGLKNAVSIDFDRKYWLSVNGRCYLWDYELTPYAAYADYEKAQRRLTWYRFDNINASNWTKGALKPVYASGVNLVRFTESFSDFGNAVACYWKSKAFDMGEPDMQKTFLYINPALKAETISSAVLAVSSEKAEMFCTKEMQVSRFNWGRFKWDAFSWDVVRYSRAFKIKVNMKKVTACQFMFSNEHKGRDMGVADIIIYYYVNKMAGG